MHKLRLGFAGLFLFYGSALRLDDENFSSQDQFGRLVDGLAPIMPPRGRPMPQCVTQARSAILGHPTLRVLD